MSIADAEARPRFRALRLKIQYIVSKFAILQFLYGLQLWLLSTIYLGLGQAWRSAAAALRGMRHIDVQLPAGVLETRLRKLIRANCYQGDRLRTIANNQFLIQFQLMDVATDARDRLRSVSLSDQVRMRKPPDSARDSNRHGNLILLKDYCAEERERGVLLVKYNPSILSFAAVFDLPRVARDYWIVLEPSWWGYQHPRFLNYIGSDLGIVVLAQYRRDFAFIESIRANLVPIRIGPADWVDPNGFLPKDGTDRRFDLVHVAAWSPFKRHDVLFQSLSNIKRSTKRELVVALIGYPWDWNQDRVYSLARRYGVEKQIEMFERISHSAVSRIVADSRASLFLSDVEGSPKALQESLFSDTPVIVNRHNRGIDLDRLDRRAAILTDHESLSDAILEAVDNPRSFQPRQWALENSGYGRSTAMLNETLKHVAHNHNEKWTGDIVSKMNAPHLRYVNAVDRQRFEPEYERLSEYLKASTCDPESTSRLSQSR